MSDRTIRELANAKRDLENQIGKMLGAFCHDFGVEAQGIELQMTFASTPQFTGYIVTIALRIVPRG